MSQEVIDLMNENARLKEQLVKATGPIRLEARPAEGGEWTEIYPSQLQWAAKQGHDVRAIEVALPDEKGKSHD